MHLFISMCRGSSLEGLKGRILALIVMIRFQTNARVVRGWSDQRGAGDTLGRWVEGTGRRKLRNVVWVRITAASLKDSSLTKAWLLSTSRTPPGWQIYINRGSIKVSSHVEFQIYLALKSDMGRCGPNDLNRGWGGAQYDEIKVATLLDCWQFKCRASDQTNKANKSILNYLYQIEI